MNFTFFDNITDEVIVDVDMFGLGMEAVILGKSNGRLIVS